MASKTPVIASDIGGNAELVEDGVTGFLFNTGDERDLAEKMSHFINNSDIIKKFGENAYNKIRATRLKIGLPRFSRFMIIWVQMNMA